MRGERLSKLIPGHLRTTTGVWSPYLPKTAGSLEASSETPGLPAAGRTLKK